MSPPGNPNDPNSSIAATSNLISLICVVPPVTNLVGGAESKPSDAVTPENLVQILADTLQIRPQAAVELIQQTVQRFQSKAQEAIDAFNRSCSRPGGGKED
jgi:hypothetical protein